MPHQFHVNVGEDWTFHVDERSLVASPGGPAGTAGDDAAALIRGALEAPIDFPSLASASVPGDRIAVVVDPLLPHAPSAVCGAVDAILRAGADAERLTVVLPGSLAGLTGAHQDSASAARLADVQLVVHNPEDRAELAYLTSTSNGQPVYLNRSLCDADLLIPMTCVGPPANARWRGIHGSIYPTFSESAVLDRYRSALPRSSSARPDPWRSETDEVGWLLGVCMAVGVVPGSGGTIHQAAAGTPPRVEEHCVGAADAAWHVALPRRAPLVIALVGRGNGDVTWDDFASALSAAKLAADEDGAVAVCGNFTRRPGRSLRRLADAADLPAVAARLQGDAHEDTWAAQELAAALFRGPVYFAGGLPDDQVEALGMAPIGGPEEVTRLASRFGECIVLRDAEWTTPCLMEAMGSVA